MTKSRLNAGCIHLWFCHDEQINDAALLTSYQKLLNPEERKQQQRFHFARDQHQYLVTRALVRTVLSGYLSIKPKDLCFKSNKYGRPEINGVHTKLPLRFNLTHTQGLIICAVVLEKDIGVDVENRTRHHEGMNIAEHFFSTIEFDDLIALAKSRQQDRFFDYWVLKEAYIKARGMGLTLPLDQFSFYLPTGKKTEEKIKIYFEPQIQDQAKHWRFYLFQWQEKYKIALAIRDQYNCNYQLQCKQIIPLLPDQDVDICPNTGNEKNDTA